MAKKILYARIAAASKQSKKALAEA